MNTMNHKCCFYCSKPAKIAFCHHVVHLACLHDASYELCGELTYQCDLFLDDSRISCPTCDEPIISVNEHRVTCREEIRKEISTTCAVMSVGIDHLNSLHTQKRKEPVSREIVSYILLHPDIFFEYEVFNTVFIEKMKEFYLDTKDSFYKVAYKKLMGKDMNIDFIPEHGMIRRSMVN